MGLGLWAGGFGSASGQPHPGGRAGSSGRGIGARTPHLALPRPRRPEHLRSGRFAQGGDGSFRKNPRVRREPSSEARELPAAQPRVVCISGRDGQLCVTTFYLNTRWPSDPALGSGSPRGRAGVLTAVPDPSASSCPRPVIPAALFWDAAVLLLEGTVSRTEALTGLFVRRGRRSRRQEPQRPRPRSSPQQGSGWWGARGGHCRLLNEGRRSERTSSRWAGVAWTGTRAAGLPDVPRAGVAADKADDAEGGPVSLCGSGLVTVGLRARAGANGPRTSRKGSPHFCAPWTRTHVCGRRSPRSCSRGHSGRLCVPTNTAPAQAVLSSLGMRLAPVTRE